MAINALFLDPPMGGVETYLRELCRHLLTLEDPPQLTVLLNPDGYDALAPDDWATEAALVACPRLGRNGVRAVSELVALGLLVDRRGADIVHSVAMTGPLRSRARRVVTIPDTIWITHPEATATHRLWRAIVPRVASRAHRVIAISQAASHELEHNLTLDAAKVDVIPLGHRPPSDVRPTPMAKLRVQLGLSEQARVVLNVGQKKPHRNLEGLVRSLSIVRERIPEAVLVLPGPPNDAAERALRELGAGLALGPEALSFPGYLDQEDLEGLYAGAEAFVLPSLVEGFGLPVLEAMARGTPVACSDHSAPAEVAGDAALLFDPEDDRAIAAATLRLLSDVDLREGLATAGLARAAAFTWEACARGTRDSYARALGARA